MPTRSPAPIAGISRRGVLGGAAALAVVGVTGCDSLDPTSADPTITPTSTPTGRRTPGTTDTPTQPATEPEAFDDSGLVAEVLSAIALAHRGARANARLHPEVAEALGPFEDLHRVHGKELGDLPATTGRVTGSGDTPAQALARVDRAEERLQRVLIGAAGWAGSGALAQTFASMAAGVAQLRTTL